MIHEQKNNMKYTKKHKVFNFEKYLSKQKYTVAEYITLLRGNKQE